MNKNHEVPEARRLSRHLAGALEGPKSPAFTVARVGGAAGVLLLLGIVGVVVDLTGGTHAAYVHAAYIPILLAASLFGIAGGVAAGLVAGLAALGPVMPMDTAAEIPQPWPSWLFRTFFFVMIGAFAGALMERSRSQLKRIETASFVHPVSRLPTQLALERLIGEFAMHKQSHDRHELILVDLKNFDHIFNTLGPEVTQQIPSAIADRLRPLCPQPWQLYHIHAGKTAVLAEHDGGNPSSLAEQVVWRLEQPVTIRKVPVYLDAIAGAVALTESDTNANDVLRRANIALAEARRRGVATARYQDIQPVDRQEALHLLADASEALENDHFVLAYQPQIRLTDQRIVGAEALIRWQHPRLGLLAPGRFIPILEETALINRLTAWVARATIRQAAEWQRQGVDIVVSFNVSPRNLDDPGFVALILQEIHEHGVPPDRIELEITESAIIDDATLAGVRLEELKAAGVGIALDDFGDGYTSVRHLTALPIDKLKLDRALINGVIGDARRRRIVTAVTHLAQDLGLQTVAEGVEDHETAAYLGNEGCDVAQGYYFSKAIRAAAIAQHYASSWPPAGVKRTDSREPVSGKQAFGTDIE